VGLTVEGGKTVTTAVGNTPRRAAVAQSPAWMRGGSLGRARRRAGAGGGGGEEKRARTGGQLF
jgi:hypothetical protein